MQKVKVDTRYFIAPDPDSNEIIARELANTQQADTAELQSVQCSDGRSRQMWEVTPKQVEDLGILRQSGGGFGFEVYRMLPGGKRPMFSESYSRSS